MTLIRVDGGTVNETSRRGKMHKSRRKILDVLNNEYRKDTFGTHIVTQAEREAKEREDAKRKEERSNLFDVRHTCPKCDRLFNKIDRKFFYKTGQCFNCQSKFITELKGRGLYLEWEEMKMIQNELAIFRDSKQKFEEALADVKPYTEMVTDSGFINKFEMNPEDFKRIKTHIEEDLAFIEEKTPIMINRLVDIIDSLIKRDKDKLIAKDDKIFQRILEEQHD